MNRLIPVVLVAASLAVSACATDERPSSPIAPSDATEVSANASLDLSGVWSWSETTILKLRPEAVALFGAAVEGPVTHIECNSSGQLTLTHTPAGISGAATQQSSCITQGGQAFDPPLFPPGWTMTGELNGRSLSFVVDTGLFPCPYRGSVRVLGGQAVELKATGGCEVPSELGQDKILNWRAVRQ